VLKIFKIMTRDVPYFLQFFMCVIFAFACAVSLISNRGSDVYSIEYGFYRFLLTVWTFIKITVGSEYTGDYVDVENVPDKLIWVYDLLMTSYGVIATLLMLNLLIAIIGTSYEEYGIDAESLLLLERFNIMCAMVIYLL
jgi:hypothetical protein